MLALARPLMGRTSKLDRLGPEIRDEVVRLRERGRTVAEILGHLRALDIAACELPSRSGLAREIQPIDVALEMLRQSRVDSEAIVRRRDDEPEGRQGRANVELMQGLMFKVLMAQASSSEVTLTPKDTAQLAKAMADTARAERQALETRREIKREMREEAERELAKLETESKAKTVTPAEMIARIRALYAGEA